jgi:hypothetical protein
MASSPSQSRSRTYNRHLYQMVSSKDDDAVHVSPVLDRPLNDDAEHDEDGERDRLRVSWKKQALLDLKPGLRRDS